LRPSYGSTLVYGGDTFTDARGYTGVGYEATMTSVGRARRDAGS
jgi:hypothetical protein